MIWPVKKEKRRHIFPLVPPLQATYPKLRELILLFPHKELAKCNECKREMYTHTFIKNRLTLPFFEQREKGGSRACRQGKKQRDKKSRQRMQTKGIQNTQEAKPCLIEKIFHYSKEKEKKNHENYTSLYR